MHCGIGNGQTGEGPGIMVRRLQTLDVHGKFLRLRTKLLRRSASSALQQFSHAFAGGNLPDQRQNRLAVAELQLRPVRRDLDQALADGFEDKGHGAAGGNRVHAEHGCRGRRPL